MKKWMGGWIDWLLLRWEDKKWMGGWIDWLLLRWEDEKMDGWMDRFVAVEVGG